MIENLKKHSGTLKNTGVRVAVVFRKLATDDTSCLIVETEKLPDSYHDYMIQCLNSRESSETNDFFEVLHRRTFPDGLNCLTALHQRGFLRKEPVTNVVMMPLPGQAVPLSLINATIDNKVAEYKAKQKDSQTSSNDVADAVNSVRQNAADPASIAKGLIFQAEVLEADAAAKREEAYGLAPELRPGKGRPSDPESIKAEKAEARKVQRRENDRKKAAEKRATKAESAIDAKVSAKLARDASRIVKPN
jgi:hypothetical protein